jgi:two-component sensor histidine kinase
MIELSRRNGEIVLAVADNGQGVGGTKQGTGLSIVQALVRDELKGTLLLRGERGLRAEVTFPA